MKIKMSAYYWTINIVWPSSNVAINQAISLVQPPCRIPNEGFRPPLWYSHWFSSSQNDRVHSLHTDRVPTVGPTPHTECYWKQPWDCHSCYPTRARSVCNRTTFVSTFKFSLLVHTYVRCVHSYTRQWISKGRCVPWLVSKSIFSIECFKMALPHHVCLRVCVCFTVLQKLALWWLGILSHSFISKIFVLWWGVEFCNWCDRVVPAGVYVSYYCICMCCYF